MTGETKRGESLHARRSHARQRAISRTHSIMIRSFACQNSQACSAGAKEERAGVSAISKTGLLNTAMRDNDGSGRKLSKTRKSGVSKFNILICHKPKVRFRNRRPFSHQAITPTRSEEHTSELQSLTNLVCRLLLEKKKETVMMRGEQGDVNDMV